MDPWFVILVLLHGCHLLALASLFGTLVSLVLVAPAGLSEAGATAASARDRLVSLARQSDGAALLIGIVWTVLQAAAIASATSFGDTLSALVTVLSNTRFGHLVLLRFGLLLAAFPLLGARDWRLAAALTLAGMALAMQGGMGHAGATGGMAGVSLLLLEALHLLAAGAWLGGLLPLSLLVGSLPPQSASVVSQSFSTVGLIAVLLIAGTALAQSWQWIGNLGGLFGTRYGQIALLKLGLFFALLALAGVNRFVLTERLRVTGDAASRRILRVSIAIEAILGVVVFLAAAFLASGTPATHETPIWPFSWRPSLDALSDPYSRRQILIVSLFGALVGALATVGVLRFRALWLSLAGCVVVLLLTSLTLVPLPTIDAYPTTFATSPTEFADSSIVRGATLFTANCAVCHGADARGDGPAAKSLPIPPADLTAAHLWARTELDFPHLVRQAVAS
jgi:putative copper export protein